MSNVDLSVLEKQLEAKAAELASVEKELAAKRDELEKLRDSERQRPLRASEIPLRVERNYRFRVSALNPNDNLEPKEFECCDESEALRCYAATTPDPRSPTKQIDLVKYKVKVVCLDVKKREEDRLLSARRSAARAKFHQGLPLSKEELKLIDEDPRFL